jgi:salicylate 5-hydroxylase small subunit
MNAMIQTTPAHTGQAKLAADDYISLLLFYQSYAETIDSGDLNAWPALFTEDCVYKIQSRENFDRQLPLATMAFESRGMLKDRVYCIRETLYYEPYLQRHVVGAPVVTSIIMSAAGDEVHAHASYAVFRTKPDETTHVYNVGRYEDIVVRAPQAQHGWLLKSRVCVFDSDLILNSMIYPI